MRGVLVFLMTLLALWGYDYNRFLLHSQIALYPKIMEFDQDISKHIDDGTVDFCILYEEVDAPTAQRIAQAVRSKFHHIDGYPLRTKILKFARFVSDKKSVYACDALYILRSDAKTLSKVATMIEGKHIYTFTYDINDLQYGFLCNVAVEKNVNIYLNKKVLQRERFDFATPLFSIAKVVE